VTRGTTNRRLLAAERAISSLQLSTSAIEDAYGKFLRTGDLPEDPQLGWTVLKQALHARKAAADMEGTVAGSPRERVFQEAVHSFGPARMAARLVIRVLVLSGDDPTDPEFIPSDTELPEFGGVAMNLLGWPDRWVRPPYEDQMQRVMRQHAQVRSMSDHSDAWYREAAAALPAFLRDGELPIDDLLRLLALTIGEMFAIHAHYFGRGDEALLAAYDAVATTSGAERDDALHRLALAQARSVRNAPFSA
jgi:hypothetical protein